MQINVNTSTPGNSSRVLVQYTVQKELAEPRMSVAQITEALHRARGIVRDPSVTNAQREQYQQDFAARGLCAFTPNTIQRKPHPWATQPDVVERIVGMSLMHPAWGPRRLQECLLTEGIDVVELTIYNILKRRGMQTKEKRLRMLEDQAHTSGVELSAEQMHLLELVNPCYRERQVERRRPGELLVQDTLLVRGFTGMERLYLHAVIDMYSAYAFGFLYPTRASAPAVALLQNNVRPFFRANGLRIEQMLTDGDRAFCGGDDHPFEMYLTFAQIAHQRMRVHRQQINGFMDHFHHAVDDEFFKPEMRTCTHTILATLQAALDRWLVEYNTRRPHQGYPHYGQRPSEVIDTYLAARSTHSRRKALDHGTGIGEGEGA